MSVRFTGFTWRQTDESLSDSVIPQHTPWCLLVHDECNSIPSEFIMSCIQDHEVVNLHLSTAAPSHLTHTQKFESNSIHLGHHYFQLSSFHTPYIPCTNLMFVSHAHCSFNTSESLRHKASIRWLRPHAVIHSSSALGNCLFPSSSLSVFRPGGPIFGCYPISSLLSIHDVEGFKAKILEWFAIAFSSTVPTHYGWLLAIDLN